MDIVINEWCPEYFKPLAKVDEKKQLEDFLNCMIKNNHHIYVRRPSPFLLKLYKLTKDYSNYSSTTNSVRKFIKLILQDSNRCTFVDDNEQQLSSAMIEKLNNRGNTISDKYLFEAASITQEKLIITSDQKLIDHMNKEEGYSLMTVQSFLDANCLD